jgi:hypothetical protein
LASKFNDPFDCNFDIALRSTQEVEEMAGAGLKAVASWAEDILRAGAEKLGVTLTPRPEQPPSAEPKPARLSFSVKEQDPSTGEWHERDVGDVYNTLQRERMAALYRDLDQFFGVLCLCERADDILLWSHYGSSHGGLCLEFDAAAHPKTFPRLHPVRYQSDYPHIPAEFPDLLKAFLNTAGRMKSEALLDVVDLLSGGIELDAEQDKTALGLVHWFYVKSSFWSYEREWRCLKWKPGSLSFPPEALTRIIVGCVNTDENLTMVRETIKGTSVASVSLYKAVRKPRQFGLDLVRIE